MQNPLELFGKSTGGSGYQAVVDGTVVADATETVRVESNHYFPPDTVSWDLLEKSDRTSVCYWKGVAAYYDVVIGDRRLPAAAWTYQTPSPEAEHIREHVAFWRGVKVVDRT